jgi:hypothetical protein
VGNLIRDCGLGKVVCMNTIWWSAYGLDFACELEGMELLCLNLYVLDML